MGPGAQIMKTGPGALGTAENESGSAKFENGTRHCQYCKKRDTTPSVPPKMSLEAQNMNTGPDAIGNPENGFGSAKHENGTRRARYRRKRVQERITRKRDPAPSVPMKIISGAKNMKTGCSHKSVL
jgi:hypothetical protein